MEMPSMYTILLGLFMCGLGLISLRLRHITDPTRRQWIATVVGVICVVAKGRWRAIHMLVVILVNALIILHGSKRHRHVISFGFSFVYLIFYNLDVHYNFFIPIRLERINIFMMMTVIRMIHLAGEVEDSDKELDPRMKVYADLTLKEIIHYSLCYVGLVTFYRYRTYHDWIHRPLYRYADCDGEVVKRVKTVLLVAPCIFLLDKLVPLKAVLSEDFYEQTFSYKFLYASYAGVLWSLVVAGMFVLVDIHMIGSGMGAYPVATNPRPGEGPTTNLELLDQLADNPEKAKLEKYNFHAIRGIFLFKAAFSPTYREFWRNYNCCVQYFLVMNVYKRFAVKKYRLLATFAVTAMWHGAAPFWYIALVYIVVTMLAEDVWYSLYRKQATGSEAQIIDAMFWLSRFVGHPIMLLAVTYIESLEPIIRFLASLYFFPYLFSAFMLGSGVGLRHLRQGSRPQSDKTNTVLLV